MNKIRQKLEEIMQEVRKENPNANWGNLLTGIIILVLIAVFSTWYFSNSSENGMGLLSDLFGNQEEQLVEIETSDAVVVQAGEGLWHVAQRVCGDAELYNHVAAENGLGIWSALNEGQELTVSCDYSSVASMEFVEE